MLILQIFNRYMNDQRKKTHAKNGTREKWQISEFKESRQKKKNYCDNAH